MFLNFWRFTSQYEFLSLSKVTECGKWNMVTVPAHYIYVKLTTTNRRIKSAINSAPLTWSLVKYELSLHFAARGPFLSFIYRFLSVFAQFLNSTVHCKWIFCKLFVIEAIYPAQSLQTVQLSFAVCLYSI